MSRKKIIIIIAIVISSIMLVGALILTFYSKEKTIVHDVQFSLIGPEEIELELEEVYEEFGATLTIDNIDRTDDIQIDASNLNTNAVGEYKIIYYIVIDNKKYETFRIVKVLDKESPVITLEGNSTVTILVGESYKEPGYTANDNYDKDITSKVEIDSNLDTGKEGEYEIKYTAVDSSGNTSSVTRKIIVKKPNVVVYENKEENKEVKKEINVNIYSNTITKNTFTSSGISLEGTLKDVNSKVDIKLSGDIVYIFNMTMDGQNKYKGNINFSDVANGTYEVYAVSEDKEERLLNKLEVINRIVRSKIGNKLVTVSYDSDDRVSIKVEDFAYQYDVLIDPGHGGSDIGASNKYIYEKEMNLKVSKYEKCRYENHGLKVYMTRNSDDTYGSGMGPSSLQKLHRRAYEMGYVGAVAKIVYSNHHNAISGYNYIGYEILTAGYLTTSELKNEIDIASKFNSIYDLSGDDHLRFYARDYDTEKKYPKLGGQTYTFKDNYAVNRIPHELFNVKSIIYEGIYMTSDKDYDWYWNNKNWIKVSEAKIEVYVNSLGGTYNPDNASCL